MNRVIFAPLIEKDLQLTNLIPEQNIKAASEGHNEKEEDGEELHECLEDVHNHDYIDPNSG